MLRLDVEPKGDWALISLDGDDQKTALAFVKANMTLFGSRRSGTETRLAIETGRIHGLKQYAARHGVEIGVYDEHVTE